MEAQAAKFAFQSLADKAEEHLAAKVAKGRRLVRVHVQLVRTDLHAILGNVGRKDNLDECIVGDLRGRVDELQNVGFGIVVTEEVYALVESWYAMIQEPLINKVAGQIFERFQR